MPTSGAGWACHRATTGAAEPGASCPPRQSRKQQQPLEAVHAQPPLGQHLGAVLVRVMALQQREIRRIAHAVELALVAGIGRKALRLAGPQGGAPVGGRQLLAGGRLPDALALQLEDPRRRRGRQQGVVRVAQPVDALMRASHL